MVRISKLIIATFFSFIGFGQFHKTYHRQTEKKGVLFFEERQGVFEMYFVESAVSDLKLLCKKKDTLEAVTLGSPGEYVNNISGFKDELNKRFNFDSIKVAISQKNYQGVEFQDSATIYYKSGEITFDASKKYQLSPSYKKIALNSKTIIYLFRNYVPINSFNNLRGRK